MTTKCQPSYAATTQRSPTDFCGENTASTPRRRVLFDASVRLIRVHSPTTEEAKKTKTNAKIRASMNLMRKLYIDTSVIGGYHDTEWMQDTRLLWQQARTGLWQLVTSIVAEAELQNAPGSVRQTFADTFNVHNILDTNEEIEELAEAYLAASVVPPKFADDALHVAMATVHGVRLIVSWNFKHLVNVRREDGFNAVNVLRGWPLIRIVSPKEIIYADQAQPD